MPVTDDNLKSMCRMMAPVGGPLKRDVRDPLVDGLYLINTTDKWVMSIYRNVKVPQNDIEIAIDVHALVWPRDSDFGAASEWLEHQSEELQYRPSGVHATKPSDSFRIGLKLLEALTFLDRLQVQLFKTKNTLRWQHNVPHSHFSTGVDLASKSSDLVDETLVPAPHPAVSNMLMQAKHVCAQSGKEAVTVAKNKEFRFANDDAFLHYVGQLFFSGRCALTDLQLDLTMADPDLTPSLDRIDSDGHYESGNLQVVARFVNRWKSDDSDMNFRRLLCLVRNKVNPS